ncbi:MAG TPA: DJ-1/PfpI family protein [Bacteroidota bacterium]|nr:DJ-1/PfpI family protein [Bacteroidota bacterium]
MALVTEEEAKAALAAAPPTHKVAILIFDGVEIIDFTGPYEIFGAAGFDVYTVARTKDPITTAMGMTVVPRYTFDDVPQPDVLVVPGGGVKATQENEPTLNWIKGETARINHTMSVCNGAFILASAGLLDGLSATTTNGNIPRLRSQFPKINVVGDRRYVDNGKIITAAGLSAGIDGALHVVELLEGKGAAEQTALVEEYDWEGNSRFVRASLADHMLPNLYLSQDFGNWDLVSTEGSTDHWNLSLKGTSNKSAAELMNHFDQKIESEKMWKKVDQWKDGKSRWALQTKDGKTWSGTVSVQIIPGESHKYTVVVSVAKGG